jgi:proline dehydrogenase
MDRGDYPAFATHDETLIEDARAFANERGYGRDRFEFQMLYGIRRDLQAALTADGYRVRIYLPFGHQWFPYFMRRLGERPANIGFVLRGILQDR